MNEARPLAVPILNKILNTLSNGEYSRFLAKAKRIELVYGETIYGRGDAMRYVYFLDSGIISLLAGVGPDTAIEVGIVGREGIIGLPVFLGVKNSSNLAIVQGAGFAMRIEADDFLTQCESGGTLSRLLKRFTHSLLAQASQSAACLRFHVIEHRLARWLLMTSDRMESDKFPVTQEFLSNMLGVRREAVSKAAIILQDLQLIGYTRGRVTIKDRKGLENTACACYGIIRDEEKSFPVQ